MSEKCAPIYHRLCFVFTEVVFLLTNNANQDSLVTTIDHPQRLYVTM